MSNELDNVLLPTISLAHLTKNSGKKEIISSSVVRMSDSHSF